MPRSLTSALIALFVALFLTAASTQPSQATTSPFEWIVQFGTSKRDLAARAATDSQGFLYVYGQTEGALLDTQVGGQDLWLAKYEPDGIRVWGEQFGHTNNDVAWRFDVEPNGTIYLGASSMNGTTESTSDVVLGKYTSDGVQSWLQRFGSSTFDTLADISSDAADSVYVLGHTRGVMGDNSSGNMDYWLAEYDVNGNQQWISQFGTSGGDVGGALAWDGRDHLYLGGYIGGAYAGSFVGLVDAYFGKYTTDGNRVWHLQFGSTAEDRVTGIDFDSSGNVYFIGFTDGKVGSTHFGSRDIFLAKYDTDGNRLWLRQIGSSGYDMPSVIQIDTADRVWISGNTSGNLAGPNLGSYDAFVGYYDSDGNPGWSTQFGTSASDTASVHVDLAGNVYVVGETGGDLASAQAGLGDVYVAKLNPSLVPPLFSITGRVTSGSDVGLADVSVGDGGDHNTITDASGYYTLTGIMTGTYSITPAKVGYSFVPPSQDVSVPPSVADTNFTGNAVVTCYILSTSVNPSGSGTVDVDPAPNCADGKYQAGTPVTLTAKLEAGYSFGNWGVDASGSTSPVQIVMNDDKYVTAYFDYEQYVISGQVFDSRGFELDGVRVSAVEYGSNLDRSPVTTTDSEGEYSLDVWTGSYKVKPNMSGFEFEDDAIPLSVPPNATGLNFQTTASYQPGLHFFRFENRGSYLATLSDEQAIFGPLQTSIAYNNRICHSLYFDWFSTAGLKGNCSGMVVASLMSRLDLLSPAPFGGVLPRQFPSPVVTTNSNNKKVWNRSEVATLLLRLQAIQKGCQVLDAKAEARKRTVAETLETLLDSLENGLWPEYFVSVRGPFPGSNECIAHALLPYAYDVQDGVTKIYVYDPNEGYSIQSPERVLSSTIEYREETGKWTFSGYSGIFESGLTCGGQVKSNILAIQAAPYFEQPSHPCVTFCLDELLFDGGFSEISASSNANVLISDQVGNRIGVLDNGDMIEEMEGAFIDIPEAYIPGQSSSSPESYIIESTSPLTVSMTYGDEKAGALAALYPYRTLIYTGTGNIADSDKVMFTQSEDLIRITSASSSSQREIAFGSFQNDKGKMIRLSGFGLGMDETAELAADADWTTFRFKTDHEQNSWRLTFAQTENLSTIEFQAALPNLNAGDTNYLLPDWDGGKSVMVQIDHGSDGTIDDETVVWMDPSIIFMPDISQQ